MLLGDFYKFSVYSQQEGKINATIDINKNHTIFEGHFPEFPIVPGVCQVNMVKEILNDTLDLNLQLSSSKFIKFLSMINPNEVTKVTATIQYAKEEDIYIVSALISADNRNYLKLKGEFSERK